MLHPIPLKLPLTAQAVLAAPFRFLTGPQLGHTVDGPRRNTYAAQQRSRRDLPAACVRDDSAWHCALTAEQAPLRPQCRDRLCVQRYAGMSGSANMTARGVAPYPLKVRHIDTGLSGFPPCPYHLHSTAWTHRQAAGKEQNSPLQGHPGQAWAEGMPSRWPLRRRA